VLAPCRERERERERERRMRKEGERWILKPNGEK
jgi:hypothetical protein